MRLINKYLDNNYCFQYFLIEENKIELLDLIILNQIINISKNNKKYG